MTLAEWSTLTPAQASKRLGAANLALKRASKAWDASGTDADEIVWTRAFAYWENLMVLSRCGYRSADPYVMEND